MKGFLSLDAAIKRVGQEFAHSVPAMADELLLTEIELNFLPDRQQALKNLATRGDVAQLRAIVASLLQAERFGTPLSGALRVLSAEFREERMIAAEEKAARLPTLMTLPMIGLILPSLFCVVLGPAAIHVGELLKATH